VLIARATGDRLAFAEEPTHAYRMYPADRSGEHFVIRESELHPWVPVTFAGLTDGSAYLFTSGRVTPKVADA
jgi:hypothetical protein